MKCIHPQESDPEPLEVVLKTVELSFKLPPFSMAQEIPLEGRVKSITPTSPEHFNRLGDLTYKRGKAKEALVFYIASARQKNKRGVYNVAEVCSKLLKNKGSFIIDLYKHAVILRSEKAIFRVGQWYEQTDLRMALTYFSYLIEKNASLYLELEKKYGSGYGVLSLAKRLLKTHSDLCPPLLKLIYEKHQSQRKDMARYLARGYGTGKHGFKSDSKEALKWLKISASLGNLEDRYRLSYTATSADQKRDAILSLKMLVTQDKIKKKFGIAPYVLLARFLAEEEDGEKKSASFQEAVGWLLKALNGYEEEKGITKRIVWKTDGRQTEGFAGKERRYLDVISRGLSPDLIRKNCYELAFHYLWGGYERIGNLAHSMECFLRSDVSSRSSSYFFVAVINQFLSTRRIIHDLTFPRSEKYQFICPSFSVDETQIKTILSKAHSGDLDAVNHLALLYASGGYSDGDQIIRRDLSKTLDLCHRAANEGSINALCILAHGFRSGWFGSIHTDLSDCLNQKIQQTRQARETYGYVTSLLENSENLNRETLKTVLKKLNELSLTQFDEAALTLAFYFRWGLYGLSPSVEHEIYWLKLAAEKDNCVASSLLNTLYPLIRPLTEDEKRNLHRSRVYDSRGRPKVTLIGGGLSGVMTAIMLAHLTEQDKLGIGDIYLLEQNNEILTGASALPCRLHLGWEYSKEKGLTGKQCLLGALIFKQMFQTERVLTPRTINDFLLAKESLNSTQDDDFLSEECLKAHSEALDHAYKDCLAHLIATGKYTQKSAEDLLFGSSPLFTEIEEEELKSFGLDHHFAVGIHTSERGLNPVGLGVVLESLLKKYTNIHVVTGYCVTEIDPLIGGGFRIKGRENHPHFESRYLINAAWDNNAKLKRLLGTSPPEFGEDSHSKDKTIKRVYLRSLAFIDLSNCVVPSDRSFFGLVGSHGGMVSILNTKLASIFIPQEGLSYQGEYVLREEEGLTHSLPSEARQKQRDLEKNMCQIKIAGEILEDAKLKYPWLAGAHPLGLMTRTTVSGNNDICQRPHIGAHWIEGSDGCLEIYATKATFAPLVALEAVARFVSDCPDIGNKIFSEGEQAFLEGLEKIVSGDVAQSAFLPECFRVIQNEGFMEERVFQEKMKEYAFKRNLPLTVFDESEEAAKAGLDSTRQFELMVQNESRDILNLFHHTLTQDRTLLVVSVLKKGGLVKGALGPLEEEINDDENDKWGETLLTGIAHSSSLESLRLTGWNLMFSSRFNPLSNLIHRLQDLRLESVTLSMQAVDSLFGVEKTVSLKHLSLTRVQIKVGALKKILKGIARCKTLEILDLSGNKMQETLGKDTDQDIEQMIARSPCLKHLFLRDNGLFGGVRKTQGETSLPSEVAANQILIAITHHPNLEKVDFSGNGVLSSSVQDHLDSYFLSKSFTGRT